MATFPVSEGRTSGRLVWRGMRPLVLLALALVAILVYQARIRREMVDFTVWQTSAVRAVHREPLYRESDGHYQFKYFPAFAVLMAPFGLIEQSRAKFLWYATSLVLLVTLMRVSTHSLPNRRLSESLLLVLTLLLMAKFYARELLLGQTNVLLGALLVAALSAIQHGRSATAGALVGLAVFVKPYALIFLPWFLITRAWRASVLAVGIVAAGLFVPATLYGWSGNLELLGGWFTTVVQSTEPNLSNNDNISVAAMWAKWMGTNRLASTLAGVTILALIGVVLVVWRKRESVEVPEYLECALLMLLIPLISPQGWDYVLLLATPAVVCVVDRWGELTRVWQGALGAALGVMGLTMFDLMGRAMYGRFMALSVVSVCALMLAVGLLHLRVRRLA